MFQPIQTRRASRKAMSHHYGSSVKSFRQILELGEAICLPLHLYTRILSFVMREEHAEMFAPCPPPTLVPIIDKLRTFCRVRPLTDAELEAGEDRYPTISCATHPETSSNGGTVFVHDGRIRREKPLVVHRRIEFDGCFDENADENSVFEAVCAPLLANRSNRGTIILFGQTGTGKSHTIHHIQERLASLLDGDLVDVNSFEIRGQYAYDLLGNRQKIGLCEAECRVHVKGSVRRRTNNKQELLGIFRDAHSLRSTEAMARNAQSSRSHAICQIERLDEHGDVIGAITLVDLAGSERNLDTSAFTSEQHKESAEIMLSLMSLKQCILALAKNRDTLAQQPHGIQSSTPGLTRVPFRNSVLTMILKECFEQPDHLTSVVGTVSPISDDLEHTISTLNYVSSMRHINDVKEVEVGCRQGKAVEKPIDFKQWDAARVRHWLGTVADGQILPFVTSALHATGDSRDQLTGAKLLRMNQIRLTQLCGGDREAGEWLFDLIRAESNSIREAQAEYRKVVRLLRNGPRMESTRRT